MVVLFSRNIHQVLPVISHGYPTDIIESCIKRSGMWTQITKFYLKLNMRTEEGEQKFASWLLKLGNDELPMKSNPSFQNCTEIPKQCYV